MAYAPITPYADETYGDAYFGERLGTDSWDSASSVNKNKAMKHATRTIDLLPLVGEKYDETQEREFPRDVDGATVPAEVQDATCEVALALLEGRMASELLPTAGVASESAGDVSVSYTDDRGQMSMLDETFGLGSHEAANLLAPWIEDPALIDINRV